VQANLLAPADSIAVPPLLVVADGTPDELQQRIDRLVQQGGWRLIIRSAALLEPDHLEADW
jgi:hypothetical protein